jgi:serine-type D-Ala-D-Ala carboxypeptidase (penicillin-binding protein 5/6)
VTNAPRRLAALAAAIVVSAVPAGRALAAPGDPELQGAASAIVVDASDGTPLFRKNAGQRRAIASTTKLMTALLALERARPTDVFAAPPYDALPQESKINLATGERMKLADLLEALLLESANDAAVTIAEGVSGSREAFVEEMNDRAVELGLADTSFANPIGLDDPDNYSTAADLATLSSRLMRNRRFARIVDMPRAVLESGARERVVANRNDLVAEYPFVDGIKTGHTLGAGYLLVGAARGRGARVVTVVMGEPGEAARDADTLTLLRWGLGRFRRVRALDTRRVVARPGVDLLDERAALVPRRRITVTVRRGQRLERRVRAPKELEGPLPAGERVGSVTVLRDGRPLRTVALVTARPVPGPGTLRKVISELGLPLLLLLVLGVLAAGVVGARRLGVRMRLIRDEERSKTGAR